MATRQISAFRLLMPTILPLLIFMFVDTFLRMRGMMTWQRALLCGLGAGLLVPLLRLLFGVHKHPARVPRWALAPLVGAGVALMVLVGAALDGRSL